MMPELTSPGLQLTLHPEAGSFSLQQVNGKLCMENARFSIAYRLENGSRQIFNGPLQAGGPAVSAPSTHGLLQTLDLRWDQAPLSGTLTLALGQTQRFLLLKAHFENTGGTPLILERITLLQAGAGQLSFGAASPDLAFHANGWQSWSHTATTGQDKGQHRSWLGPLQNPMVDYCDTPHPARAGHYTADFFAVFGDRGSRCGLVAGFLSQKQHFGTIEAWTQPAPALSLWANGDETRLLPGSAMDTDWAIVLPVDLDDPDPLGPYLEMVAREHEIKPFPELPVGWCSWYYFYDKVTAEDIRRNLSSVVELRQKLPVTLFQIDDGFESQVGDWFTFRQTFPEGVAGLARDIRGAGLTPGLWLAPYIVHSKAELVRQHPDWILRTSRGKPVNAGFVWNNLCTALDLTVPAAFDYTCEVISKAAHEWGYPYLKLDFLYAAALPGVRHDMTRTRAQVLRQGLEGLRRAAGPETLLLGCGTPLGPSLGLFEMMRISCDVSGDWAPQFNGIRLFFNREPHMPSARNAIHNILSRASQHRRWWLNDPDCLLVRADSHLNLDEVQTLAASIALTGGSLLLSDDMPKLDASRISLAQSLLPPVGQRARLVDWFDEGQPRRLRLDLSGPAGAWHVLALFNWSDAPVEARLDVSEFDLPAGDYTARSFWNDRLLEVAGGQADLGTLPPHGCHVLALRPLQTGQPQYLGSSLHISQGMEVAQWQVRAHELRLRLDLGHSTAGEVDVRLPALPKEALLNGQPAGWSSPAPQVVRLPVDLPGAGDVLLKW